jgi:ABC-type transport system involved in cytochrome c biogenesis permease subunit
MLATIGFGLLILAVIIQVTFLIKKAKGPDPFSHFVLLASAIIFFWEFIDRSIRIHFVAVTNVYETMVLYAGLIALLLFVYRLISKERTFPYLLFGGTVVAIVLMAVSSSPLTSKDVLPPIPALQSYWLVLHVTTAMIGESFFVVGFVAAILYLATKNEDKKIKLDRLMYVSVVIGYLFFTAGGLIFASIWAQTAWGRYWGWDPKETWSLITWLTYTAYLHSRFVRRLRGKITAILLIIGFLFTLFTIFGVNYLLSGLHSY